ncbi:MAG: Gfo/Idh/MocA family oxidoreductase [bacterium]
MKMKRRTFLKSAAATAFAFQFIPRHVLGGDGSNPPSRKINLAAIGAGGQAGNDLGNMASENIVAICDVDDRRAAGSYKRWPDAKRYKDFRKMFDDMSDKIDAVLVGTPDHTHAVAAMAAMKRGKHVFCEKPLARSVSELRAMRNEAATRKLITQTGNQGHSTESIRIFVEWVQSGAIGQVTEVHAACCSMRDTYDRKRNLAQVMAERPEVPKELDWDLWQGPVAERPYHTDYLPWNWRGWTQYGSGVIGDWVCHVVDPSFWALDLDMPTSIQAETDNYDPVKHVDLYPESSQITYEFPAKGKRGPVKLVWYDGGRRLPRPDDLETGRNPPETGAIIIGTSGKIMHGSHGGDGCRLIPETAMKDLKRPDKTIPRVAAGHYGDWLNAIREGRQASSPFEYGARLSEVGLLGMVAIRMTGKKLLYDEKAMKFTNCDEANKWLNPPYRKGWSL